MTLIQDIAFTQDEYLRAAESPGVEFVHGQFVEKPRSMETSETEIAILSLLRIESLKKKSVRVFNQSVGYRCFPDEPSRFRKPDASVVKSERLIGIDPDATLLEIYPDLAVEVVSKNDTSYEVSAKVKEYLQAGFPLIWVVHPNTRTVSIHRGDGSVSALNEPDEITGESAFPEFKCKVSEFFI